MSSLCCVPPQWLLHFEWQRDCVSRIVPVLSTFGRQRDKRARWTTISNHLRLWLWSRQLTALATDVSDRRANSAGIPHRYVAAFDNPLAMTTLVRIGPEGGLSDSELVWPMR